jgi:hypothetical protein
VLVLVLVRVRVRVRVRMLMQMLVLVLVRVLLLLSPPPQFLSALPLHRHIVCRRIEDVLVTTQISNRRTLVIWCGGLFPSSSSSSSYIYPSPQ